MHFYYILLALSIFIFSLSAGYAQTGNTATEQLYKMFEAEKNHQYEQDILIFPSVLPTAQNARAAFYAGLLDSLEAINHEALSSADRINYEVFKYILQERVAEIAYEAYLLPFNAEGGFYNSMSWELDAYSFENPEAYESYLAKLRAFPQYMRDNMQLMRIGIQKGVVAPRLIAAKYKILIAPFQETDLSKHLLYKPFLRLPASWRETLRDSLTATARQLLKDSIHMIYSSFDQFMEREYLPACRNSIGISEIPKGRDYYRQRVAFFTSLPMEPEDVFAKGEAEVARIRAEMEAILRQLDYEGSFADFLHMLRSDKRFYAATPKDLLKEASYIAKKIDGRLPEYFLTLPRLSYGVEPVPAAIAPQYTGGRYHPGSAKAHRAGQYWVNTYKLESRPLYVLPALTLHEAVPGHHLQIALTEELGDLPSFRNTYLSAFGEGWALYCEWLGKEMGIYETAYEDFGRLTYEMWRACRLVVDVGIHYKGWSRQRAYDFLSSNTALSIHECNTEIDRYIGWPGQAVSYKIGELKIRELRQTAEAQLGDHFDIRIFHDWILRNGAVPLFVLERLIFEELGISAN